ncbi:Holliday junction resolvase RuvX [Saccharothrix algeriensis]|uniref:Putative pre-16S rRNA nuclease n=1 Tax=Saccharothrix algeriensis TaxID=173560 RepID=A0A8T8HV02_9PSEU|nr:Holliday junction resolvase RuvX [Saccharothrix algeriensis]MBM7814006.1 putative Holliday junction resolvase [Saccharothrix algeriensis]QTR02413.1 Holliday junction resolvase RuvX [Saccharothrix algeriensis]
MSSADRPGVDDPGLGRRLGVDVGSVRVGVALSDPSAFLATPLVTLARDGKTGRDLADLAGLVTEHDVVEVVVGLPRTLAGRHGPAAESAAAYAAALAERVAPVPVRLHDERLTTVTADRVLAERGVRGKRRRAVVDQAAAVEILQSWLDGRSRNAARPADEGRAPGAKDRT